MSTPETSYTHRLKQNGQRMAAVMERAFHAADLTDEQLATLWDEFEELIYQAEHEVIAVTADGIKKQLANLVEQLPDELDQRGNWKTSLLHVIWQSRLRPCLPLAERAQISLRLAGYNRKLNKQENSLRWAYEAHQLGMACSDPYGMYAGRSAIHIIVGFGHERPLGRSL